MASILQVYNTLRDLTNKEQKGFITPQVFNTLAPIAQMNVYNEFFTELVDAKRLSRQGFELGRDKSVKKQKQEDLSYFVKKEVLTSENNVFTKPYDLSKVISVSVNDVFSFSSTPTITPCEILYDVEKANYVLGSNLSTPTDDYPVALVAGQIEVFPTTVSQIELTYYRSPSSWKWSTNEATTQPPNYSTTTTGNGTIVPNSTQMRDFMLPNHCVPEIVSEMAKLLGVRLRDPNVQAFASREEAAE